MPLLSKLCDCAIAEAFTDMDGRPNDSEGGGRYDTIQEMVAIFNGVRNDMPVPWRTCCFVAQCVRLSRHAFTKVLVTTSFKPLICCKSVSWSEMDWLNCRTVLPWVICVTLLVMCPHADCFLSLCMSLCFSISLYVYSVYDFYNNNNNTEDNDWKFPIYQLDPNKL